MFPNFGNKLRPIRIVSVWAAAGTAVLVVSGCRAPDGKPAPSAGRAQTRSIDATPPQGEGSKEATGSKVDQHHADAARPAVPAGETADQDREPEDGVRDVVEETYEDGSPKEHIEGIRYANGRFVRDGATTIYWETGEKKSEVHYREGLRHGLRTSWYQDGKLWSSGEFIDNAEHGTWTTWYPNGVKGQEMHFDHGAWHGKCSEWDLEGNKRREYQYVDGLKQGVETLYQTNGDVLVRTEWVDGLEQP